MTMAGDGATKVVKPEAAVIPGIPASNGTAPAGGDPANGAADPANSYWAAQAAVMQSYYNGGGNPKAQAPGANGQQAAAYYAQMAQQPNLYAQMWANPTAVAGVQTPFPGAASPAFPYGQLPYATSFFGNPGGATSGATDAGLVVGGPADAHAAPRANANVSRTKQQRAGPTSGAPQDERELKRQRRKQSNRESARRSRLRKQAECEDLGSRVGGLTEENLALKGEVRRLTEQCSALVGDNKKLRGSVTAAGGVIDTLPPALPAGPTEEEKKAAQAAGAKAAAEAMTQAKKAAALAAGDSDAEDDDGSKDDDDGREDE